MKIGKVDLSPLYDYLNGSQIEGERVVVYDNSNAKHVWNYRGGKYITE
ncbi:hypothetical protein SAMN05443270_3080 [Lacrimispora sphenoides]|nr:hypothetical protein [Lacrimispora sphenoides]SEU09296.1 hypothetical protein SAMN05443270_3080 [Lacrimispora sphenoides]